MNTPSSTRGWRALLQDLRPASAGVTMRECLRIMVGTALAIVIATASSQWLCHYPLELFWHGASIAASALLIFTLPSSPLAQPWTVIVGNLAAGMIGMLCSLLIPITPIAGAVAVALTIFAMIQLRAVHPPAAALAFYMVLQHVHDPQVLLFPLGFNLLVIVLVGVVYNRLTGRAYPHRQVAATEPAVAKGHVSHADVDQALARYNEVLAMSRADLMQLLQTASGAAYQRHLGDLRCGDAMRSRVISAPANLPMTELGQLLREHRHRTLPVVDEQGSLLGSIGFEQWMDYMAPSTASNIKITDHPHDAALNTVATPQASASEAKNESIAESGAIALSDEKADAPLQRKNEHHAAETLQDTHAQAAQAGVHQSGKKSNGFAKRFLKLMGLQRSPLPTSKHANPNAPTTAIVLVRDRMEPSVVIAKPEQALLEIIPILSQGGRYHVPVINDAHQLVGIITQTDLLRTLDGALPDTHSTAPTKTALI